MNIYLCFLPNSFTIHSRLSINWHVAVGLKNNGFSVTISYLLYCLHVICIFFRVQCSNPAELPTLVCSYTKVVRNNVYYMHGMKMQWLLSVITRMKFSRVSRKQRNSNLIDRHVELVNYITL